MKRSVEDYFCFRLIFLSIKFSYCEKGGNTKDFCLPSFPLYLTSGWPSGMHVMNCKRSDWKKTRATVVAGHLHMRSAAGTDFCVPTFFSLLFVIRMAMGNAYDKLKAI